MPKFTVFTTEDLKQGKCDRKFTVSRYKGKYLNAN